ncbi:MAG: RNA-binding transcriptional accessory protein, partial [Oscillospiraceae bacterium]|nr:RNA-binding transcriptional accessory protein [Oscillospiraceae bacterium]
MTDIIPRLARELNVPEAHAASVAALLDEGNTIPFIARYRKEAHGAMDDQLLRELADRLERLRALEKRRAEVRGSIEAQGAMTEALSAALEAARTLAEIEDIYRPFKPKRRTRAMIAREKGLEPLAEVIFAQELQRGDLRALARAYVDPEKGVDTEDDAIGGACDIAAEIISDDAGARKRLREMIFRVGAVTSRAASSAEDPDGGGVYRMYHDYSEPAGRVKSHRMLALNRGEKEGLLTVRVDVPEMDALNLLYNQFVKPGSITSGLMTEVCADAWKRLLEPSMEREIRSALSEEAGEQAIRMFALNLRPLLMQPPLRGRVTMGLDPGFRTGCKVAVVDATGKVLDTGVAYITHGARGEADSAALLTRLIRTHNVEAVAIGNGTASRETERFVAGLLKSSGLKAKYTIVNESGASVYSASKLAAEEFPEFDVTLRSAVSIARRLQDPLAELVKIDPKSIGVGQYQHDMPPARLAQSLDGVVESCVNAVGVDVNTASAPLLTRVAGVGAALARNIVAYREQNGPFRARRDLKRVPKLGARAFEQAAGFLRVPGGSNVLDNTAVHPESYEAAGRLLDLCGYAAGDVGRLGGLPSRVAGL